MKKIFLFAALISTLGMQAKTIYCKMEHDWWHKDGAGVSCRAWNTSSENAPYPGVVMNKVDGEDYIWSLEIDDSFTHCMFVRCQGGTTEAVYFGSQTGNIELPIDDKCMFVITNEEYTPHGLGQKCEGYWTYYPALDFYLVGWIENADYTGNDYLFEEGSLLVTFTDTAYIALKDSREQWYMTEGWLGFETTSAIFYTNPKQGDKLCVPGPSQVMFIYYDNPDGSILLEYEIISTGLEDVLVNDFSARKIIENGQLFILKGNEKFTILGTLIK